MVAGLRPIKDGLVADEAEALVAGEAPFFIGFVVASVLKIVGDDSFIIRSRLGVVGVSVFFLLGSILQE